MATRTEREIKVCPGPTSEPVTIGYLERWEDDPGTFDGWLSTPDMPTDELVVNGAPEAWARYLVLRRYLGDRLKEIDATAGFLTKGRKEAVLHAMDLLAAVAEEMEMSLLVHTGGDE